MKCLLKKWIRRTFILLPVLIAIIFVFSELYSLITDIIHSIDGDFFWNIFMPENIQRLTIHIPVIFIVTIFFLVISRSVQYFFEDYTLLEIIKKGRESFSPVKFFIISIISAFSKLLFRIKNLIFHPAVYIFIGFFLFVSFHENYNISIFYWVERVKDLGIDKLLKEFGIFLIIAALASFVIESKAFIKKASDLIFLHSDYLKNMSAEKKKKFFAEILRNTYKFSDYDVESDFANISVNSFLPAFEESYKRNYSIRRDHEEITKSESFKSIMLNLGYEEGFFDVLKKINQSPWNKSRNKKDDFFVHEEKNWITHFSKTVSYPKEYKIIKKSIFLNYAHLFQKLMFYSLSLEAEKLDTDDSKKEGIFNSYSLGKIEFYMNPNIINTKSVFNEKWKDLERIMKTREKEIFSKKTKEYRTKNFEENIKKYFFNQKKESLFLLRYHRGSGKKILIIEPSIKTNFKDGIIELIFEKNGIRYLIVQINTLEKMISFEGIYEMQSIKEREKYRFTQKTDSISMREEGTSFGIGKEDILKNIEMLFVFPEGMSVIGEVSAFSGTGSSPKIPNEAKHYLVYKHYGWLLSGHGLSVWYKILE